MSAKAVNPSKRSKRAKKVQQSTAAKHHEVVKGILAANVYDLAKETPLQPALSLSERLQHSVWIKREDLQSVFSFKIRGAFNCIRLLTPEQQQRGVVAASAGNHAQGVALAAQHLGITAVIVMPNTTPEIKIQSVRNLGAQVVLVGDTFDEAAYHAQQLVKQQQLTYIHPFDDPNVIAGQGTIGIEIMRQSSQTPDAIFLPVGGGGLIAGVATYVKYLNPEVKIIGVESTESASLAYAFEQNARARLSHVGIFADGVAVAQIGQHTWALCQQTVDQVIQVTPDEICAAIKDLFVDTRAIAEPSGALALAGLKKYAQTLVQAQTQTQGGQGQAKAKIHQQQRLVAVLSGANLNFDRLRYIAEVAEIGEGREALLGVTIAETPGSFREFCKQVGKRSITEFNYRFSSFDNASIYVGIKLAQNERRDQLIADLTAKGYQVADLSEDETAKYHIRHMIGGHPLAKKVQGERLFRFEFPERPGALMQFLERLGQRWNITLFHYRNHGAASGRVMVALEIQQDQYQDFIGLAKELGFPYFEETQSAAYQLFLSPY